MQKATFSEYTKNLVLELSAYQLALVTVLKEQSAISSLPFDEQDAAVQTYCELLLSKTRLLVSREFLDNPSAFQTVELASDDHSTIYNLRQRPH